MEDLNSLKSGALVDSRPVLRISGLSKSFMSVLVLDSFDLDIAPGEIHALIGENGSGKSTIIKILAGFHTPDRGEASIDGERLTFGSAAASHKLGCRFVHQDLGLVDALSISDNLAIGTGFMTRFGTVQDRALRKIARNDLRRVGLDLDPRLAVDSLMSAQRTGVALARAMRDDPTSPARLLVLDEPTAALPEGEVDHLLEMIRAAANTGVAILYVSHRLEEVLRFADNVTVVRDGKKVASQSVAGLDRKTLVDHMIGHATLPATESPVTRARAVEAAEALSSYALGEPILKVAGLSSDVLRSVDLTVSPGEIVGVAGITGSGSDQLLGTIFGATKRESGTVKVLGRDIPKGRVDVAIEQGLAYMPADRIHSGGIMNLSALENLTIGDLKPFWRGGLLSKKRERAETRHWFERLQVRPPGALTRPLETFSGGNQQKVLFGKWLRRLPLVFLIDEPTQGVDVGARAALHNLLISAASGGMGVVISSSDVRELAEVCQRIVILNGGRVTEELTGGDITPAAISRACLSVVEGSR